MDSLPNSAIHQILSKVASESMKDFGNARIAYQRFNDIGREAHFYRSTDLIFMNNFYDEVFAVRTFKQRCYEMENPEAIYLRGMYEYFMLHLLDEGRNKIRIAGERGCSLANYVDKMLNLAFSVDGRGFVHDYPGFSREYVHQMYSVITRGEMAGNWDYEKPQEFMDKFEKIDPNTGYYCGCYNTEWMCDRCFWQTEAWNFCDNIHLTARYYPIP